MNTPPGMVAGGAGLVVGVGRKLVEVEPVAVGRGGAVFEGMVKLVEAPAGVVEDAVEDHANVAGMAGVEQAAKRRVAAQNRIDLIVVVSVIAVVGGRGKN